MTISELKQKNIANGGYWFDPSSIRFFKSKIHGGLKADKFFISSEQGPDNIRRFSIRIVEPGYRITTFGDFQAYRTLGEAKRALNEIMEVGS